MFGVLQYGVICCGTSIVWCGASMVHQVEYELVLIIGLAVAGLVWLGGVPACQMNPRPGHYGKSMIV